MDTEKSAARRAAEWAGIVVVLGVCGWMMFGDALVMRFKYMGTELSYAVSADHAGAEAAVRRHMDGSMAWRCYFGHVPMPESSSPLVNISVALKRVLRGPPVNEPSRYNSNGHVQAVLSVSERGRSRPVYFKTIQYKLPAVFTFTSEATGNGQEDVFRDTEGKAVDEIVAYLAVAAMKAMALRPENASHYLPILTKSLSSTQTVIYDAAAETLCGLGRVAAPAAPEVKKLLKERQQDQRAQNVLKRVLKSIGGG